MRSSTRVALASMSDDLQRIADAVLEPVAGERTYAGRFELGDKERKDLERELGIAEVQHPLARVAILTVALNLKNRLDAMRTLDGADVLEVISRYEDVQALRDLLGPVTGAETMKATALYDTLAT